MLLRLNLELGAPLTHLNHLSTFLWVSDEPSVRSAFVWPGTGAACTGTG